MHTIDAADNTHPAPSAQHYEQLREQFLDGRAHRGELSTLRYHGIFHGLQQLSSRTTADLSEPQRCHRPSNASTTPTPHAIVQQVATLLLNSHPEILHAY